MIKNICNKVYDTENSVMLKKYVDGVFGDPTGYEETLYVTNDGHYFMYENGGENSIHPKENIRRMSKATAEVWMEKH